MREIKFRAWDAGNNEWRYYSLKRLLDGEDVAVVYHIDHSKTGQFTGLRDKNGKEIYEGDILRHRFEDYEDWSNYEVVYEDAAFIAREIKPPHYFTLGKHPNFEVIGNVYETPELLTNKKV